MSLEVVDYEYARQKLAGLVDVEAKMEVEFADECKLLATDFVAALPAVFSDQLERITLWDKIESSIRSAYAKTASSDADMFISLVLQGILASGSAVVREEKLGEVMVKVAAWTPEKRQEWMRYINSHL